MPQFVGAVSSKWKDNQHVISFPEMQRCIAKQLQIAVVGIGYKLTFTQVLLMKHIKDLTNNSQGLISSKHIIMVGGGWQ